MVCVVVLQEDQYLLQNMYEALERDSLLTTHSVSLPVSGSTQIREMFDAVSYSKVTHINKHTLTDTRIAT